MNSEGEIRLRLESAVKMSDDLNEFVVAFDQIFSRIAFAGAGPELLVQYFVDRDVRRRLSEVRGVLYDAIEAVIGSEAAEELGDKSFRYFEPLP